MRVAVSGARDWTDDVMVFSTLDILVWHAVENGDDEFVLFHGECPTGADRHAAQWFVDRKAHESRLTMDQTTYPAKWRQFDARKGREFYKPQAGLERTTLMLETEMPDVVVAFHDSIEWSKGTRHAVEEARRLGLEVWLITHPKEMT